MEAGRGFFPLFLKNGGGGLYLIVGRLSGVNARADLCVREWCRAINGELFTHQTVSVEH